MSYTTNRQPEGRVFNYTNLLRQAMLSELVAINDYSKIIQSSDMKALNELLQHIMEEEKEHYGMFLNALRNLDPQEYKAMQETKQEKINLATFKELYNKNNMTYASPGEILREIREGIKGELEAIILYEDQVSKITIPEVKQIFAEVIYDEKHHVEELTTALLQLDIDPYGPISNVRDAY